MAEERVLLPAGIKPLHYDVHLTPDFTTFNFDGTETVTLDVREESKTISFNSLEIDVSEATVTAGDKIFETDSISKNDEEETFTVSLKESLPVGTATLSLVFKGRLNDNLAGFYRSKYQLDGEDHFRWIATTQFEPADARRAFPCWDEPAVKATFGITITAPEDLQVLSNMPEETVTENKEAKTRTVKFQTTPIVSTYLIAFVVGKFENVETTTANGTKFRVWTTPGKKDLGRFALDVGAKVLDYFGDYFGIPFPLPKQDMIAIPDFSAGAMENWGLITYRETALLCDVAKSSVLSKARVAYVVSHELAHQWFGNLVTMEWWRELWLNEGFATFVGNQATAHFFPDWNVWTQFVSDYIFRALSVDSLRNSHPIEVDVSKAREIDEIFDEISYSKGASVIRMIENYLGEENFKKGLNLYLEKFKYGNAKTNDLWEGLSKGSGENVSRLMNNWVEKIGYPLLTVEEGEKTGEFKVTQRRFLGAGEPTEEEDQTAWIVNVGICSASHPEIKYVEFSEKSATLSLDIVTEGEKWVKFNAGQAGFYRVRYSSSLYKRLGEAIKNNELSTVDRLGIQNDAFALAKSGAIPLREALALVKNYKNETDYTVWSDLTKNLKSVSGLLSGTPAEDLFSKFCLDLYSGIGKLGWESKEGEAPFDKVLRSTVLAMLGDNGDNDVIAEAKKHFAKIVEDHTSVSSDLHSMVFKLAARNGSADETEQLKAIFNNNPLPDIRISALMSVGLAKDEGLISSALEYAMSDEVRSQDIFYPILACASTAKGRNITWEFIKTKWDSLNAKLGNGNFLLGRIIKSCTSGFSSEDNAKDVEEFFQKTKVTGMDRTVQQSLESIRSNCAYLERNLTDVTEWLKEN